MRIVGLSTLLISCMVSLVMAWKIVFPTMQKKIAAVDRKFELKSNNIATSSESLSSTTKSLLLPPIQLQIEQVFKVNNFFRFFQDEDRLIEGVFIIDNIKGETLVADYSSNIFNITKCLQLQKKLTDYSIRIKSFHPSQRSLAEKYLQQLIQITKPFFPNVNSILENDNYSWQKCSKRASLLSPKKMISPFEHFKESDLLEHVMENNGDLDNSCSSNEDNIDTIAEPLEFSFENVDKILDDIRPYLQADGGNVALISIDSTTRSVQLQLQGACGSCPSSTTTMKFGIECRLQEAFNHSLSSIVAINRNDQLVSPTLTLTFVEEELAKLLPAIEQLGGEIKVTNIDAASGTVFLNYQGPEKLRKSIDLVLRDIDHVEDVIFQ